MGWRCGIWRWVQSSTSEWLADGSGGFRPAFPLIAFGIVSSCDERMRLMTKM
jgi:hypothetical protein